MTDERTTLADLRRRVAAFVSARDWEQFHTPKNLSVAVAIEAAELMEHFQWLTGEQAAAAICDQAKRAAVADELADVLIYTLSLVNVLEIDVSEAVLDKLERNESRFPADEWRGRVQDQFKEGETTMIGKLPESVLQALLETVPIEFSVIDANDEVLAWNKHETRIFKRPVGVVGRNVRKCHPEKSLHKVEQILSEIKAGTRDKARFWIDLTIDGERQKILIEYYALRDAEGNYLGCAEVSQNIQELQSLTGEKRLLD